ncbi:Extradiol ring-cleavage dioxygenase, class III enzyme, subunit B [Durotheca rogersii]|uniref:Extradiol ring-cleavage dioxygenase, class III enzyme, subunit B n=1 Tax=Durotheca rogersii TaxID=419775 RepID=UPI00221F1C0D|nr:Extradiol ring-cleavage dioxygenase, class III enzyme, subunit B [Durotheca rogersii]KAI5865488.1 Extradiol ring-cleavage dioxygenase, class III enzyme, subunit B [Durotheca rogersii]
MPSAVEPSPSASGPRPLPVYFIGHAGVGLLFDESPRNHVVQDNLRAIGEEIRAITPRPKAILTFSGHFEASEIHGPGVIEVNVKKGTHIQHDFVNDFHDSRPSVYEYEWPHTDAPELAVEVWRHLGRAGIKAKRVERGVDHGVWVPFKLMFPAEGEDAAPLDVPIVQVSTFHGYDLAAQIRLGEAVAALRNEGYLIVASGMAVHSFEAIASIRDAATDAERERVRDLVLAESRAFDAALRAALAAKGARAREQALLRLAADGPALRRCHPTVEHFTPLLVAAGAATDADEAVPLGVNVVEPGMSYLNVRFA